MQHSMTDSRDDSRNALSRLEMPDASLRQGLAYALGYAVFVLALTCGAVWVWPLLGPWFWAPICVFELAPCAVMAAPRCSAHRRQIPPPRRAAHARVCTTDRAAAL